MGGVGGWSNTRKKAQVYHLQVDTFNLSWFLISFPDSGKTRSMFPSDSTWLGGPQSDPSATPPSATVEVN